MSLLSKFKDLADNTSSTLSDNTDLDFLYNHYNIPVVDNTQSGSVISNFLYATIKEKLQASAKSDSSDIIKRQTFFNFRDELVYRYILYGENPFPYLSLIERIRDATRDNNMYYPSFSNNELWKSVIIATKDFFIVSPASVDTPVNIDDYVKQHYTKEVDIANSFTYLIAKGCEIEIVESELKVKEGIEKVVSELDSLIKKVGGLTLAQIIFQELKHNNYYSINLQRYLITRNTDFSSSNHKPEIPWGYLLNKSLQFPTESNGVKNIKLFLKEIQDISMAICIALYKTETYSTWEYNFKSGENLIEFLNEVVLWDSIYAIPQCRPDIAIKLNEYIFNQIDENDFFNCCGFSLFDFQEVSKKILFNTKDTSPRIIYWSTIKKELKSVSEVSILKILHFISHDSNEINKNYNLPHEYTFIDFPFKPLIKLGETKFLLMDKSWCSPAFYESIAIPLRLNIPNFDSKIGYAVENAISKLFDENSIVSNGGDYSYKGVNGECDFAIETENTIVLIELKKKVLTRASKSGNVANVLIDLLNSVLDSQIQASRTEILLRKYNQVELIKNGKKYLLKWNNRTIEKISLTFLEYGGFQNRIIIERVLTALSTHNYITTDESFKKKFENLETKQKELVSQILELRELEGHIYNKDSFFNTYFMSLPQLYHIIENANDNNSFVEILHKTKYVSMGAYDFYKEFLFQHILQNKNT